MNAFESSEGRATELAAQHMSAGFDPASGQLRELVAEVDVKGELKEKGNISRLAAQRLELSSAGAHPRPRSGAVSGNVQLMLESAPVLAQGRAGGTQASTESKNLTATAVRFEFRQDGGSVRAAETIGPGTLLVIPSDPKVGPRVITAGQFLMAFDAHSRLETLRGLSPTRVLFRPAADAPPGSVSQESLADRLEAVLDPVVQTLREVRQSGNFQFRDGERQATAQEALYNAQTQSVTLTGRPQVWDTNSRMKSERFSFDLRNDIAEGVGKVQGTHLGGAREAKRAAEPTNVLADRMIAQQRSQVVHYEGHVRAWHGADVVESSAVDVYRAERRVSSGTQVLTSHLQPASLVAGSAPDSRQRETRPLTIRADLLEYLDQGRKARYRGNVRLQTENTTLDADRLEVFFSQAGTVEESEVDRAVAEGHVRVIQPGRRASGDHAEYFAGPGKIVLTGGPPSLYDADKGFTTGQRLTFFIHDDRLFVDGGDESPTLSKHRVAQ